MIHFVYLLRCNDNTLYCGYTIDLKRRLHEHNHTNKGAKYVKKKLPVKIVYFEKYLNKNEALKRENAIKKFSKAKKEELVSSFYLDTIHLDTYL